MGPELPKRCRNGTGCLPAMSAEVAINSNASRTRRSGPGQREGFLKAVAFGLAAAFLIRLGLNGFVVAAMVTGGFWGIPLVRAKLRQKRHDAQYGRPLSEPFRAEVLLDGTIIAVLSDRQFADMFWHSYRIAPVSSETARLIADDRLWMENRLTLRAPETGAVCSCILAGGGRPYVRNGRIELHSLLFKPAHEPGNA